MFRAFRFVLALILCTSALSTAHAAPSPKEAALTMTVLSKAVKAASVLIDKSATFLSTFRPGGGNGQGTSYRDRTR